MSDTLKQQIYKKLSYTNQDYETILNELISMFSGASPISRNWNNMSEADPLFIVMSLMAAHKDILNYMVDYRIVESFMSTARERSSLVRIANSYGYKIPSFKAARARFAFSSVDGSVPVPTIELPSFSQFVDSDNVSWVYIGETNNALPINNQVEMYQGVALSVEFNANDINTKSMTHIISNQAVSIGNNSNGLGVSKLVASKDGVPISWVEVPDVRTYTGNSQTVYELNVDPQGITYIKFRKELNLAQYSGYTFRLDYVVTQGANITSAATARASLTYSGNNYYANFTYVNDTFVLGSNAASADDIKEGFINYYASNGSLSRLSDYTNYVLNSQTVVPNITKCITVDKYESTSSIKSGDSDIPVANVAVYAVKDGNIALSSDELLALFTDLKEHKTAGIALGINGDGGYSTTGVAIGEPITNTTVQVKVSPMPADSTELKALVSDYVSAKNIGEKITTEEIRNIIMESNYASFYTQGLSVAIKATNKPITDFMLPLEYYQNPICAPSNVVSVLTPGSLATSWTLLTQQVGYNQEIEYVSSGCINDGQALTVINASNPATNYEVGYRIALFSYFTNPFLGTGLCSIRIYEAV